MHKGIIISTISIITLLVIISSLSLYSVSIYANVTKSRNLVNSTIAYFASEGGIEDAALRIKNGWQYPSSYDLNVAGATSEVLVNSVSAKEKEIIVTGVGANNVSKKIKLVLTLDSIGVGFHYGVQVGEGGLIMEENATVNGSVYSNGSISGGNGAKITGDAFVASGITLDHEYAIYKTGSDYIFGKTSPIIDIAQSFKPVVSGPISMVSLYIKKHDHPGSKTVRILTNSGTSPTKTSLTSGTLDSSKVTSNYGWVEVSFTTAPTLTAGTTYWIMIDSSADSGDYYIWGGDSDKGYANGEAKYSSSWSASSPTWTPLNTDLDFKIYMGGSLTYLDNVDVGEDGLGDAHAHRIDDSDIERDAYAYEFEDGDVGRDAYFDHSITSCDVTRNAYYASSNACTVHGQTIQQAPAPSDPVVIAMPISQANINQWKSEAEAGGVMNGNCGDGGTAACDIVEDNGTLSLGPKKINGNLLLKHTQTLVVSGTLYFTGHIYIDTSSGATIKCDPAYGELSCAVISDGWINVSNNGIFQGSGAGGSYILMLTTLSGCNGGWWWEEPCTHHNGAIDLHNGVDGDGAIFYSANSLAYIHNGADMAEVVAYKLELENGATINYEIGLLNAQFSKGPSAGWQLKSWSEE